MALSTYAGLKASAADWLNRSDLTSAIPDFVTMATAQLTRRLIQLGPVREMFATTTLNITAEKTNLPSDFYGLKSLYLYTTSDSGQVQYCEPEKIAEQKILRPNQDGDPQLYTIIGSQIQFWPWNTGTYSAEIGYWQTIPALVADGDTNWLLTKHPDAYLYTTLIQSAPYLKDDDRVTVWGSIATQIVQDIVEADKIGRHAPNMAAPILTYPPP